MTEEQRQALQFKWSHLGDIAWGRPTFGNRTSVLAYRMMQFSLRDLLIREFGAEVANRIFYQAGLQAGRALHDQYLTQATGFDRFIGELAELLEKLEIGLLRVERVDQAAGFFVLTISEDLDCSGLPITHESVCTFDEGLIAGLFSVHLGQKCQVRETDCWCTGDRVCRFEVTI
ncbi:MAG TPA: 4-vinyl reductase [Desulfurivibrio alkaliphilus]|uniref:4-vinyl reductase n=1 Tax=Desulfurivibrio alkaliphilus TaxID=427923 RepID=A0A7C2TGM3_9BACT|nr:4-vinyl reductase [Desulfurivibrio alkaliphilus]